MKTINNELIRSFHPCYDPSEMDIPDNETLPVLEWVEKYRGVVPAKDIVWLLCRNEFMSVRDLRLFAVWCTREALKLIEHPDARSIEACNVAERFANGDATMEEMEAARDAALDAWDDAMAASWDASDNAVSAMAAAMAASRDDAWDAWDALDVWDDARDVWAALDVWDDAREAQLNKLLTYFK